MELTASEWISVADAMPKRFELVLMFTPFCRYKCATGFHNGFQWKGLSDELYSNNTTHWARINIASLPEFDQDVANQQDLIYDKELMLKSDLKTIAINFQMWLQSNDCWFSYIESNAWLDNQSNEVVTDSYLFDLYMSRNTKLNPQPMDREV